ncbi:hypothetical protein PINS_up012392 [Pythium insidiosum]|nr:hypothetical protein PINS_up012392 [Pythium insidiosum]
MDDRDDRDTAIATPATTDTLSFEHLEAVRNITLLTRNEYPLAHLPREKLFKPDDAHAVCFCTFPRPEEPEPIARCDDVSCINFATYIECSPSRCDAGKYCQNQRLQHPERFPRLEAFKTQHKGYGVRARDAIAQGTVIGEYVGEIIDQRELTRRLNTVPRNELNFYYLALEPGVYIDARNKGSFTRFMNHSCEPNCKTEKWTVEGETRIAVLAVRDIGVQEELTFDYQWKALGSKSIKCFCESANCKGVIGAEATNNALDCEDEAQGFFREPTKEEIGSAIVGRRIRLFWSPEDTSLYSCATVRRFVEEDNTYELEYEDGSATPEDMLDSPQSAENNTHALQPFVKLSECTWHLYVDLTGLSEEQLEKAVFSIPKRRQLDGQDTPSISPVKTEHETTSPSTSTPPSSVGTPSLSGGVRHVGERRDHDGELLDADGEIVTNKILVKGIPPKCDEALLRRLFVHKRGELAQRPSTMLQHLHAMSSQPKQPTHGDIVVNLDMFFFDDDSGWALVEFSDSSYPSMFKRNLNTRQLLGRSLRVFHAGRKEVDNFYRWKRNLAERSVKPQESDGDVPIDVKPEPYCYGRALNWLVSVEQVENSPSRRSGMSASLEDSLRARYVKTITRVSSNLHLPREDATSAIIALHRSFTFRPIKSNADILGAGMLHLFLKANARKFSWTQFVSEVYDARNTVSSHKSSATNQKTPAPQLDPASDVFKHTERQIIETEVGLLDGLLFDLSTDDLYALLDAFTLSRRRRHSMGDESVDRHSVVSAEVQKEAKRIMSETLRLTVWAHTPTHCVVLSVVYVSCAVIEVMNAVSSGDEDDTATLLAQPAPGFLSQVATMKHEKEMFALLDCCLALVDRLKDRWLRLERQAKLSRESRRRAERAEDFDTEMFAVRKGKPMEITQRITELLKKWISGGHRRESDEAKESVDSSGSTQVLMVSKKEPEIRVIDVMQRLISTKAVSASTLSSKIHDGHIPSRLRVANITNVMQIRKRSYLGVIASDVNVDQAGEAVYLQPWPYRDEEPFFGEHGVSKMCVRELCVATKLTSAAPACFLPLVGVVFPDDAKQNQDNEGDTSSLELEVTSHEKSVSSRLNGAIHYLAFKQPRHMLSGLTEARTQLTPRMRKQVIFDVLRSLEACHALGYVHRYVAPCHVAVLDNSAVLTGCHTLRRMNSKAAIRDSYEMSESERRELTAGSCLQVTAPEILLGDCVYTTRCDIWSAGCIALSLLFERIPLLQAQDLRSQIYLIYRQCGTPVTSWEAGEKLPLFSHYKPKKEYKYRLQKTLHELNAEKKLGVPDEAIDVLDKMLRLDPSLRSSAKELLEMPFFDECRDPVSSAAVDFASLPETFTLQRRKMQQQQSMKTGSSSLKRHSSADRVSDNHHSHRHGGSSQLSDRRHRRSDSASTVESKRQRRSSSKRRSDSFLDAESEDVPLPASLLDVSKLSQGNDGDDNGSHDATSAFSSHKRVKLDWGMGLNSQS